MRTEEEVKTQIDKLVQALLRANPADPIAIAVLQGKADLLAWVLE